MKLRNSLSISISCWKVFLKTLLTQMIILALAVALAFVCFQSLFSDIAGLFDSVEVGDFIKETYQSFVTAFSTEGAEVNVQELVTEVMDFVGQFRVELENLNLFSRLEVSYIVLFVILCVYRVLVSLSDITATSEINEFMSSSAFRPYSWYFFKTFVKSLLFACLQVAVTLLLDFVVIFASLGFLIMLSVTMKWWAIIPGVVIVVAMYSLRLSLFAFWLPSVVVDGLGIGKALNNGLKKIFDDFFHVFWKTLVVMIGVFALDMLCVVYVGSPTLSLVLTSLITFGGFFVIKCVNMVEYYNTNGLQYFSWRVKIDKEELKQEG